MRSLQIFLHYLKDGKVGKSIINEHLIIIKLYEHSKVYAKLCLMLILELQINKPKDDRSTLIIHIPNLLIL